MCAGYLSTASPIASTSKNIIQAGPNTFYPSVSEISSHLDSLLKPLPILPDDLALKMVTHKAVAGKFGNHNARLSFYGRRILKFQLALFLSSIPKNGSKHKTWMDPVLLESLTDVKQLGNHPGRALSLEKIMRWRAVLDLNGAQTGLYKIRGETLQSLIAGVWSFHVSLSLINERREKFHQTFFDYIGS